jgi:hypothetical protein
MSSPGISDVAFRPQDITDDIFSTTSVHCSLTTNLVAHSKSALNCLILDDDSDQVFTAKIPESEKLSILVARETSSPRDTSDLTLYKLQGHPPSTLILK